MTSKISLHDAVHLRRSIYQLTKTSTISDDRIAEIVQDALENCPSTFNSQSTRIVVLLKEEHTKFWKVVEDILKAIVPADQFEHTAQRLTGFSGGYGTVLFYEDPEVTKGLQTKMPLYADKFPAWAEHTSAIHQYAIWTAFEAEGLGANLQHYNPLPNQKASEIWGIPQEWPLIAQLVFGGVAEGARENLPKKDQTPIKKRLFVHGK
ncbi:hypothetical protein B0A48_11014 [Cryoendolithus antarcticus]|uniref:Nitroreductase domain-containing protein n=1 Tax=Cryoendolithus antarcticus TaxID=1507870 RepID=A0A1V8SZ17_9PEZI|nr:hypothetical protein B0A48_11014 [Cryoendolithus antarcticus]